jgi:DNA-binding GntR family transcriptional regulator
VRQQDAAGQLIVREALECAAARIYCGKRIVEAKAELAAAAETVDGFDDESPARWEAEIAFHKGLVGLTDCEPLVREFERSFRLNVFYRIHRVVGGVQGRSVDRHTRLLEQLGHCDPDGAERAIREHVRASKEKLLEGGGGARRAHRPYGGRADLLF